MALSFVICRDAEQAETRTMNTLREREWVMLFENDSKGRME